MKVRPLLGIVLIGLLIVGQPSAKGRSELKIGELVYNFGHVGVDYDLVYRFPLANVGDTPVNILRTTSNCDCSRVYASDSVVAPGDTVYVNLTFNTRNFFGFTRHSFGVQTDDTKFSDIKVYYEAMIGQWIKGIQPDPLSLFFIPGKPAKAVTIANELFASMKVSLLDQADDVYKVSIVKAEAEQGEACEVEVRPLANITSGTYNSSFRLSVTVPGQEEAVVLTIPVKIVVY